MSQQILQLNFKFNVSRNDYESVCSSLANDFAKVPGCQWKVWLMNEKENQIGGIYLSPLSTVVTIHFVKTKIMKYIITLSLICCMCIVNSLAQKPKASTPHVATAGKSMLYDPWQPEIQLTKTPAKPNGGQKIAVSGNVVHFR